MYPHSRRCSHTVLFYKDETSVRESVAAYVAAALRAGDPALVIAKPPLRQQLTIALHRQHVQGSPFGPQRGLFVTLDAEETLEALCVDGSPDEGRFQEVIGAAFDGVAAPGKRTAAYGEMVGLLCERGQYADAVRLEAMWNELLPRFHASLFCGYSSHLFDAPAARPFFQQIHAAHWQPELATA
ncbi:MAG TPA: MEDS domain-containing protein [Ramlibacter sp.]|nr:MEDS domain-containing protein [Ramlibacter sp.]